MVASPSTSSAPTTHTSRLLCPGSAARPCLEPPYANFHRVPQASIMIVHRAFYWLLYTPYPTLPRQSGTPQAYGPGQLYLWQSRPARAPRPRFRVAGLESEPTARVRKGGPAPNHHIHAVVRSPRSYFNIQRRPEAQPPIKAKLDCLSPTRRCVHHCRGSEPTAHLPPPATASSHPNSHPHCRGTNTNTICICAATPLNTCPPPL